MARSARGSRTGGRGRRAEEAVEAEPVYAEPERPARGGGGRGRAGGGGRAPGPSMIGLVIPLAAGVVAALALILTGVMVAGKAKTGMEKAADEIGVAAALAYASVPVEFYKAGHDLQTFHTMFQERQSAAIDKARRSGDDRQAIRVENEFKSIREQLGMADTDPDSSILAAKRDENTKRIGRAVRGAHTQAPPDSPILYVSVKDASGSTVAGAGSSGGIVLGSEARTVAEVGVQNATMNGEAARLYTASLRDSIGNSNAGKVQVVVSTRAAAAATGGLTSTALLLALVGLLVVFGVTFGLCLPASKGVRNVAAYLDQAGRGDLDARLRVSGGGEAAAVGRAAERAVKTFRAVQEQSVMAVAERPAMPVEAAVDASTLLPTEPPRVDGYEIEAVHKPAAPGANDYFDYFRVDDRRIGIVIADMPHPGPAGAFIAATFRGLMKATAPGESSPAAVLAKVNRVMANELKRGDHLTAMYAVIDLTQGVVSVASAGHLPLIYWKLEKKASALLNPEGIAIGLDKGPVFEKTVVDKRVKLEKGDRIVLYSDGPIAATNASGEEFGEQRFYYLVNREAPKNSAAFVNFVANEVDLFHEGAPQQDDVTIVTLRKTQD